MVTKTYKVEIIYTINHRQKRKKFPHANSASRWAEEMMSNPKFHIHRIIADVVNVDTRKQGEGA
jgi:hypothetical protein